MVVGVIDSNCTGDIKTKLIKASTNIVKSLEELEKLESLLNNGDIVLVSSLSIFSDNSKLKETLESKGVILRSYNTRLQVYDSSMCNEVVSEYINSDKSLSKICEGYGIDRHYVHRYINRYLKDINEELYSSYMYKRYGKVDEYTKNDKHVMSFNKRYLCNRVIKNYIDNYCDKTIYDLCRFYGITPSDIWRYIEFHIDKKSTLYFKYKLKTQSSRDVINNLFGTNKYLEILDLYISGDTSLEELCNDLGVELMDLEGYIMDFLELEDKTLHELYTNKVVTEYKNFRFGTVGTKE